MRRYFRHNTKLPIIASARGKKGQGGGFVRAVVLQALEASGLRQADLSQAWGISEGPTSRRLKGGTEVIPESMFRQLTAWKPDGVQGNWVDPVVLERAFLADHILLAAADNRGIVGRTPPTQTVLEVWQQRRTLSPAAAAVQLAGHLIAGGVDPAGLDTPGTSFVFFAWAAVLRAHQEIEGPIDIYRLLETDGTPIASSHLMAARLNKIACKLSLGEFSEAYGQALDVVESKEYGARLDHLATAQMYLIGARLQRSRSQLLPSRMALEQLDRQTASLMDNLGHRPVEGDGLVLNLYCEGLRLVVQSAMVLRGAKVSHQETLADRLWTNISQLETLGKANPYAREQANVLLVLHSRLLQAQDNALAAGLPVPWGAVHDRDCQPPAKLEAYPGAMARRLSRTAAWDGPRAPDRINLQKRATALAAFLGTLLALGPNPAHAVDDASDAHPIHQELPSTLAID